MTTITTAGIWIDLPASGGAADRFRADQPLGAGLVQIASSNAEFACRENNLRTLWEHPGFTDINGTLILFGSPSSNVFEFPWDSVPGFGPPVGVAYAGAHRMPLGEELSTQVRAENAGRTGNVDCLHFSISTSLFEKRIIFGIYVLCFLFGSGIPNRFQFNETKYSISCCDGYRFSCQY